MNWFKIALIEPQTQTQNPSNKSFSRLQDNIDMFPDLPKRKVTKRDQSKTVPVTLTLYRGFDADLNQLQRSGDNYILDPSRSEQGVLWFSCPTFQTDALAVATRGKYLLTYQLQASKHVETVYYDSGESFEHTPMDFYNKAEPTSNSRYHAGYELPEGWAFSYKVQKYIICSIPLQVSPQMITGHKEEEQ